ncbi:MAG TPA: DMT family transporter [Gaiellaceae bacterium]|nr:DMT family transporter [Gaiellaceae bacterium]
MAVLLALSSAALFGAMTVAIRFALARGAPAELGALMTAIPALLIALGGTFVYAIRHGAPDLVAAWPFAAAGLLAPGISQILFTLAIRDAGPSRTSVLVGTAPLFSVAIALTLLGEPVQAGLVGGAVLIVLGGILLVGERVRPDAFRITGLVFAAGATVLFAARDSLLRWLSLDTEVPPSLAAAATLASGTLVVLLYVLGTHARRVPVLAGMRRFAVAGLCFGLSYLCLFEAYYRGRVSVVSPLVATESLWAVGLSVLLLRRTELVGPRLLAGAALVVAGGALIGATR